MFTVLSIGSRVGRIVTFGKKILTFCLQVQNLSLLLRRHKKFLLFHLIINIYFQPNLSKCCSEITVGNVGARAVLKVFSQKIKKKVITCLAVTNCATRGKLN